MGSGGVLAFPQAKRDEAVGGVVGGETDGDPIPGNDPDPETTHAPGELGRDDLARLEGNLIATSAEDLVDASRRLNQVISSQMRFSVSAGGMPGECMGNDPREGLNSSGYPAPGTPRQERGHPSTRAVVKRENGNPVGPHPRVGMLGWGASGEVPESG